MLAAVLAGGLLAACGSPTGADVAATVDGTEIPRSQVEAAVRELVDDPEDLDAEQRGSQVGPAQRAVLNVLIQAAIIGNAVADRGIEVTDEDAAAYRSQLVSDFGSEEALLEAARGQAITPSLLDEVFVYQEAGVQLLIRDLAGDDEVELRTIRHILVESEEQAQDVVDELDAGADFATLAAERSIDTGSAQRGGELPPTGPGSYVDGFEQAAWGSPEGETVGPVESEFGWHVLEVVEIYEGPVSDAPFPYLSQRYEAELRAELTPRFESVEVVLAPGMGRWDPATGVVADDQAGTPSAPDLGG
jgi:parvulin-like peptidyl-prolyl isomerase